MRSGGWQLQRRYLQLIQAHSLALFPSDIGPYVPKTLIQAVNNKKIKNLFTGAGSLATAYSLALLAEHEQNLWLVCADQSSADMLHNDLEILIGDGQLIVNLGSESVSPYSMVSPSLAPSARRQASLLRLAQGQQAQIVISHGPALMQKGLDLASLQEHSVQLKVGQVIERDHLVKNLLQAGYVRAAKVEDLGSFAVRGSLLDIFAAGQPHPIRIDLFGDEIDAMFLFSPDSQRNIQKINHAQIAPLRDLLLSPKHVQRARLGLQKLADAQNFPSRKRRAILSDLERGVPFFGMEALAPLFSEAPLPSLYERIEQLPFAASARMILVDSEKIQDQMQGFWNKLHQGQARAQEKGRLVVTAEQHFADPDELFATLQEKQTLELSSWSLDEVDAEQNETTDAGQKSTKHSFYLRARGVEELHRELQQGAQNTAGSEKQTDLFAPLRKQLEKLRQDGLTTLIAVRGQAGLQRVRSLLQDHDMNAQALKEWPNLLDEAKLRSLYNPSLHALLCPLKQLPSAGVIFAQQGFALLSEEDFFGRRNTQSKRSKRAAYKTSLAELEEGNVVVHVEFGIGIYHGLVRLNLAGANSDFLLISYRDDDKLYLPVTRINQVQRYSGGETHKPRLDKLGGQSWAKTRARVKRAILAMAQELLAIYAKRELSQAQSMAAPDALYREFAARFPFTETPDQAAAIADCLKDLQQSQPMDRLVCGDVGYGKTEVALRAAMLTVLSGYQVAVLTPTTVLAQQHFLTFSERFADMPVQIEVLSRMRKNSQVSDSLARLRAGQVDVVIGTHRLLSHDVDFSKLGLLIVDEEHRFGVKDKERIKALRSNVHVLSMSATPIPRTLQMSFFGIRDLSIIDTAPADRVAIRTSVTRFDQDLIREVIDRELGRGGQVYVVHNRVQSIDAFAAFVQRLVPSAQVAVAHGQMTPAALEKVMLAFIRGDKNVLVSTTIIESGIDIPRANTMIINRADRLGLAQLYQLRGRIGRSHQRAYAYLLVPPSSDKMTPQARKRLEILQRFADLGAGFKIAQHDLELRGAGDILGKSQHGHVVAVGYEMYVELLHGAVRELQGKNLENVPEPELKVPVDAYIADDYVFDVQERLQAYQRMATAEGAAQVYEVLSALEERFGKPPEALRNLADLMVLKVLLKRMAARGMSLHAPVEAKSEPARVIISLGESSRLDPTRLVQWVSREPERLRLTPQMKLYLNAAPQDWMGAGQNLLSLARRFLHEVQEQTA